MLEPSDIRDICQAHDAYWDAQRRRMQDLKALYMTDFWREKDQIYDTILRPEVPKAYAVVESYLGSLYARTPSVVVTPALHARATPAMAEATAPH